VVTIGTLAILAYFWLRTLRRFLALEAQTASERHLRALGGMAATMAHEIRNPLGAMKGLTQLVQEDLPPGHAAQSLMRTVVSEAERLEGLVSDLLAFARPKEPEMKPFDFAALVSSVRAVLDTTLEHSGIVLKINCPPSLEIVSDEDGLRQVLLNALLNSLEATPKGGLVTLQARSDGRAELTVEIDDSGPGLCGRNPEELFQPFVTTKTQGTGLGLAICRGLMDAIGGTISLADGPKGGARCTIRVPSR
jgi:two-component system sensor histidine kinase HydH